MNKRATVLLAISLLAIAIPALAQAPRLDSFWARRATGPITLNGILSEPEWAQAESMTVRWAQDTGIPGSGWQNEGPFATTDATNATLKLLVVGNEMYLGARIRDKSIGGSKDFNRHDGLLMSIKDHLDPNAPKPPAEYFYAWWYPTLMDPQPAGQSPAFIGKWATWPPGTPRTPTQIANWDAVTVVHGTSNTDAVNDTDYVVEMRFNLAAMGYNVTQPQGDIVEWNISIYDCDWLWPIDPNKLSYNRVWWQGPWGNAAIYNEVHVYARPNVTTTSGALPVIAPELIVSDGFGFAAPTVNGNLNDPIWNSVTGFDIRYGDAALRQTYPGVGPARAGQYQPPVNGGEAPVLDPGDATVKLVWKDRKLYFGFDFRDQVVQFHPSFDRWDGALISINDRKLKTPDNTLLGRRLSFQVGANGTAIPQDYLLTLVNEGKAQVAITLNAGTTVDTIGTPDTGFKAEVAIDLTALGYPPHLGDGTLFLGIDLLDGDSFIPITDSYGTRTWWFREYEGTCCPVWAYMRPTSISDAGDAEDPVTDGFVLLGASPNPSLRSTIRYSLPKSSQASLEVFDVGGRLVERRRLGIQTPGAQEAAFDGSGYSAGMYLYRIHLTDPVTGAPRRTLSGRIVVVK